MAAACAHLDTVEFVEIPRLRACEDCLKIGSTWLHLRLCTQCGHLGCCDDSPNRHATAHFHASAHPVIRSAEPGEDWFWCYVDEVALHRRVSSTG